MSAGASCHDPHPSTSHPLLPADHLHPRTRCCAQPPACTAGWAATLRSSSLVHGGLCASRRARVRGFSISVFAHHGAHRLAQRCLEDVALLHDVEHDDGDVVLLAQSDGGLVHHAQAVHGHLAVGQPVIAARLVRVLDRVAVIHAVHLGGLEEHLCVHLGRAQRRRGVRGEEGVAGARAKDDHAASLEVRDGAAADVRLRHLAHLDRRLHARLHAQALQCALEAQRVHDCGQHAHIVGCGALQALDALDCLSPPKVIATSHHNGHGHAVLHRARHLGRYRLQHLRVDAKALLALQRLAADLEHDCLVLWIRAAR
mmetsp:Transcript_22577/g.57359  ORF Transcript_22577/g.57359 Transcript_22577/m.57359 type:complete len:314 (+) Transcript_22577:1077-2018(+)